MDDFLSGLFLLIVMGIIGALVNHDSRKGGSR